MQSAYHRPSLSALPRRHLLRLAAAVSLALICSIGALAADPPFVPGSQTDPEAQVVFPDHPTIINVRNPPYSAVGDGVADDTDAIANALRVQTGRSGVVYLPDGVYRITRPLRLDYVRRDAAGNPIPGAPFNYGRLRLVGQSRDRTIVRLDDGLAPASLATPLPMLFWGGFGSADWFHCYLSTITFSVGRGNPKAVATQFYSNNTGAVRDCRFISEDGQGLIGLDLGHSSLNGPLLVKDVEVVGFATGIRTAGPVNSQTFERITLRGQTQVGLINQGQSLAVRGLLALDQAGPAVENQGLLTILDSRFVRAAGSTQTTALVSPANAALHVRDCTAEGYASVLSGVPGANVAEHFWTTPLSPFPSASASLRLPVRETPTVPWDAPSTWAIPVLNANEALDSAPAVQAAIDSGATTVFISGNATFLTPVIVRGNVRRIFGLGAWIDYLWQTAPEVDFIIRDGASPTVVIEGFAPIVGGIRIETGRTVVLKDLETRRLIAHGTGDVFFENVSTDNIILRDQRVWARQFNIENSGLHLSNHGGDLWVFGYKTERGGTLLRTTGGGRSELFGTFSYTTEGGAMAPMFETVDSSVFAFFGEINFTGEPYQTLVRETRGAETRTVRIGEGRPLPYIARPLLGDTPPTISPIAGQVFAPGAPARLLSFTVSDAQTPATALTVSVASSNHAVVPPSALVLGGTGADRTLTLAPSSAETGSATITLTVSDGILTASRSFQVTVAASPAPGTTTYTWHSHQGAFQPGPAQGQVPSSPVGLSARLTAYVSAVDNLPTPGNLLTVYNNRVHPDAFNQLEGYLTRTGNYPYAGKSRIARGADAGEGTAPAPTGVFDLQVSPEDSNRMTVIAFVAPATGTYTVHGLAMRRTSGIAFGARMRVFDPGMNLLSTLSAGGQRTWVVSSDSHSLGTLAKGQRIAFGVDRANGDVAYDSTEIAWSITGEILAVANQPPTITVPATAIDNPTLVRSAALSVAATDDGGADQLSYAWQTLSAPAGAQPVISPTGASLTGTANVGFPAVGTYALRAVVTDQEGASTVSDVNVQVVPTVSSLRIVPDRATVAIGGTWSGTVQARDQFDAPMSTDGVIWSILSGGGSITPSGVLTAPVQPALLTVRAQLGGQFASALINVVIPPNTPPTIAPLTAVSTLVGQPIAPIAVTIGDAETPASALVLSATSSNQSLLSDSAIVLGGAGAARTILLQPTPGAAGTATVTVTVDDGGLTRSTTFALTVLALPPPWQAVDIGQVGVPGESIYQAGAFTLQGAGGGLNGTADAVHLVYQPLVGDMTLTARLSELAVPYGFPAPELLAGVTIRSGLAATAAHATHVHQFTGHTRIRGADAAPTAVSPAVGGAGNWLRVSRVGSTVRVARADDPQGTLWTTVATAELAFGPAPVIGLLVTSGSSAVRTTAVFDQVTLVPGGANTRPRISGLANQSIFTGQTAAVPFTVADDESPASALTITATSSDPTLVPVGAISLSGSGAERTVAIVPAPGLTGTATITGTVSDGAQSSSGSFLLTVQPPPNTAPTITPLADAVAVSGQPAGPIAFTVADAETPAGALIVSASSSDPLLLPAAGVQLGGTGGARTLTLTPAPGRVGTATITVQVSDGSLTAERTMVLTVTPVDALLVSAAAQWSRSGPFGSGNLYYLDGNLSAEGHPIAGQIEAFADGRSGGPVEFAADDGRILRSLATGADGAKSVARIAGGYVVAGDDAQGLRWMDDLWVARSGPAQGGTAEAVAAGAGLLFSNDDIARGTVRAWRVTETGAAFALAQAWAVDIGGRVRGLAFHDFSPAAGDEYVYASDGGAGGGARRVLAIPASGGPAAVLTGPSGELAIPGSAPIWQPLVVRRADGQSVLLVAARDRIAVWRLATPTTATTTAPSEIWAGANAQPGELVLRSAEGQPLSGNGFFGLAARGQRLFIIDGDRLHAFASAGPQRSAQVTVAAQATPGTIAASAEVVVVGGHIQAIEFLVDGAVVARDDAAPYAAALPVAAGTRTLQARVIDEQGVETMSAPLAVVVPSAAPTISPIADRAPVPAGSLIGPMAFTLADADTPLAALTVSVTTTDPLLIPADGVTLLGAGAERTVALRPAAGRSGNASVTVRVSDGTQSDATTFAVSVLPPPNTPPTIDPIADVALVAGVPSTPIPVTIADAETPAAALIVTASSQNQGLLPDSAIVLGGTGTARTMVVTPPSAAQGATTIVVTVSDGSLTASRTVLVSIAPPPPPPSVPAFTSIDIGPVGIPGSMQIEPSLPGIAAAPAALAPVSMTIRASGADIWGRSDAFHLAYVPLVGDREITVRVLSLSPTDPWAKAGVMVRDGLAPEARHAMIVATPRNGVAFQRRRDPGAWSEHTAGPASTTPVWLRLVRRGRSITALTSAQAVPVAWTRVGSIELHLGPQAVIGVAVTAHTDSALATARFEQVTVRDIAGDLPPVITEPARVAEAPVTGRSAAVAVAASDDGGSASLTYAWSVAAAPPGGGAMIAPAGARIATATFTRAGQYRLRSTIADALGQTATSEVEVLVQATPTRMAVSPAAIALSAGQSLRFAAAVSDQFDQAIATPVTWTASSGTITADGVFTAPMVPGTSTITARIGALATQAQVTVSAPGTSPLGDGWFSVDIGGPLPGSATLAAGRWTIRAAGADIWGNTDQFRFTGTTLVGDGVVTARVLGLGATDPWAKAGVMIREQLTGDSRHAMIVVTPERGVAFQRRESKGAWSVHTAGSPSRAPRWVRLERRGPRIIASESPTGAPDSWVQIGETSLVGLPASVSVGLAVTSHRADRTTVATFDQVSVASATPAP